MANAGALSGVKKWLGREEWQGLFEDLIESHLGAPCTAAGIALDALVGIVGDAAEEVLYACVVEDMLATDFEDGSNIVDDYLKRRGWRESAPNKRYMTALRSSAMSLYEVSDIVRDQSFLARDLLRGGEPVRVSEKMGTRSLKPWDWLAARIVKVGAKAEMAGGVLPLRREVGEVVRDGFFALRTEMRAEARQRAWDRQGVADLDPYALDTDTLRHSAFLFTNFWLDDALQRALHRKLPTLVNNDGETIAFTIVRFPLKPGVDRQALEGGLTAISELRRVSDDHWKWIAPAAPRAGKAPEGAQTFVSTLEDGSVSMGDVQLEPDAVKLETNSPQRAQKGQALLGPVIGSFVGPPTVESQTVEEMMASRPAGGERAKPSGLSPEDESVIIREALDRHYRGLLDEPVPALGDVSPRKAAKTKKGREKLVEWLKGLENSNARQTGSPVASYDTSWLWAELGVADLRA